MINKSQIVESYSEIPNNTGDSSVQVAILTARVKLLTEHLKTHRKDHTSRRGLLILVSRRKSLLEYIKNKSFDKYKALIERLGIRK